MPLPPLSQPPPIKQTDGKDYRIRPLKRGDRDNAFKLLALHGWVVPTNEQELAISWVVQHPEMESFVAHDVASFSRLFGIITMSHRPQLRVGGRVACIDLFVVAEEHRNKGVGTDLLAQALRRTEALACKRIELQLPPARDGRHDFFEFNGFKKNGEELYVRDAPGVATR
ncbi:MAG: GNAT family N-acetyltransferase [Deltaproteobacteria bacterium]|nr:GNAT family N-acetyltransferase [Deltaproteobacteria bacterium]